MHKMLVPMNAPGTDEFEIQAFCHASQSDPFSSALTIDTCFNYDKILFLYIYGWSAFFSIYQCLAYRLL